MQEKPTYEELKQRVSKLEQQNVLLQSEVAKFRTLIDSFPHAITVSDAQGNIVEANSVSEELLGISKEEQRKRNIAGKEWRIIRTDGTDMPPDEWAGVIALKEKRKVIGTEKGIVKSDGQITWIIVTAAPLQIEGYGVVITYNDITDYKKVEKALNKERDTAQKILNTVEAIIVVLDREGRVSMINPKGCHLLGYNEQEIKGQHWFSNFLPQPDGIDNVYPFFLKLIAGKIEVAEYFENPIITKSKEVRQIAWHNSLLHDEDGKVAGILSYGNDITERKLAVEALKESEKKYKYLVDTLPYGVEEVDANGRVVFLNDAYNRMLGYEPGKLIGSYIWDQDPTEELANKTKRYFEYIRNEKPIPEPYISKNSRKDGSIIDVHVDWNYKFDESEELKGFVAVVTNITDWKQAEKKMIESTQRLQLATASGKLAVWDWNVKDNIMFWDERMFELYGITHETFPNNVDAWINGLHPDDKKRAIEESDAALAGEKEFDTSFRVAHPDGTVKFLKANALVIRDNDGKAVRMIGINSDITEHKQAEEERENLQSQLNQAQKMESVGRLAGGVAHDFNNMLGVILGHSEMALEEINNDHHMSHNLREIHNAAQRSADITRQLLAFARKQTIAPKMIDLNQSVEGMLKMLHRLIGEDIALIWKPGCNLWTVKIDSSQLDQILANLCVNARDAISDVGTITIETNNCVFDKEYCKKNVYFVAGDYVTLIVSDTGSGIDNAALENIFEPFYTTKGVGKGTGLGLATVYGIVKQNNGFVNVYSEPGRGTTFKIYLPRHTSNVGQTKTEESSKPAMGGSETILLVEDEPTIMNMTSIMLQRLGYSVTAAGTPGEAIQIVADSKDKIHLLVTDLIMPEMNGKDLSKILLAKQPEMQVLFMSGYTANVIAHHGVLEDGVNFIQKPFAKRDLAEKIRQALDD